LISKPLLVVYVVVIGATLVVDSPQYGLALAALGTLGFLLVGFLLFPHRQTTIEFVIPPLADQGELPGPFRLVGETIQPSAFFQRFVCVSRVKHVCVLVAYGVFSFLIFGLLGSAVKLSPYLRSGYFFWLLYTAILATGVVLFGAGRWYGEQRRLSRAKVAMGIVTGVRDDGRYRDVRYYFYDSEGNRRGGMQRDFVVRESDQVILVFYDKGNPDENISTRGFAYWSFAVRRAAAPEST
jgi:hypothetical protein